MKTIYKIILIGLMLLATGAILVSCSYTKATYTGVTDIYIQPWPYKTLVKTIVEMSEYILVAIMVFFILGCEKTDVIMDEEFIGTYNGCFTPNIANGLNSSKASVPAVAEVIMNGGQIEVHCYKEGFDITQIIFTMEMT